MEQTLRRRFDYCCRQLLFQVDSHSKSVSLFPSYQYLQLKLHFQFDEQQISRLKNVEIIIVSCHVEKKTFIQ